MKRVFSPVPAAARESGDERGVAVLIALVTLSLFTMLGLYMILSSTTALRVSDNYESRQQAASAARAGLAHARDLLKGVAPNDLLTGPDGTYTNSSGYLTQARAYAFRGLLDWTTARSLDITNPALTGIPDDGLINTGKVGGTSGTVLIPLNGIALTAPNPYGAGTVTVGRYFVKVTDNNGEAAELAADPTNNPFVDGDGVFIVRSIGAARTVREGTGGTVRANSVAVYEARHKFGSTFNLNSPFVVEGNNVQASGPGMFNGNSFTINGGSVPGISTIDINTADANQPSAIISAQLAKNQKNNVQGAGLTPSIADITNSVAADPEKSKLMDGNYLHNFVANVVPQFADSVYNGNQSWHGGSAPNIGSYDWTKPYNDPTQSPKVVVVNGDLAMSGNMSGGGLLVVRGKLSQNGTLTYNGLILVIGTGDLDVGGLNQGVHGGIFVANVNSAGVFGTPKFTIAGNSNIIFDSNMLSMATQLIPALQLSVREVTSALDP